METEEQTHQPENNDVVDTQHEPHPHAHKRLLIGVGAIIVIVILTLVIWPKWGDTIKEKCFGDGTVCEVPIPG
jgi:hypothetical protein